MTINGTWAYNANDKRFKSSTDLVRTLIDVASKGGNFLLNVGPTPEGTIQPEFAERLRAIGAWLKVNGAAIYGTTYGPWQGPPSAGPPSTARRPTCTSTIGPRAPWSSLPPAKRSPQPGCWPPARLSPSNRKPGA